MEHWCVFIAYFTRRVDHNREGWSGSSRIWPSRGGERLYGARLSGSWDASVHKYRVQRRHQQFIAIISGVLTALSATGAPEGDGIGDARPEWRRLHAVATSRIGDESPELLVHARLHERGRLICMTNYAVYPLRLPKLLATTAAVVEICRSWKTDRVINMRGTAYKSPGDKWFCYRTVAKLARLLLKTLSYMGAFFYFKMLKILFDNWTILGLI